jgi:23S rRNA (adenine2503-C2)-methyltransferase
MKDIIKNYSLVEMEEYFESIGNQKYRARQLFTWLYGKNVASFDEMSNYKKELRALLSERFLASPLQLEEHRISEIDRSEKFLFKTRDNHYIESVLLKNEFNDEGRLTICLSSQIGCQMGCTFCETAKLKFIRNLETGEILDQINQIRRITGLLNNNIVFMGMGEPFMNYDNVIKAAQIMNYTFGFHISVRKITISTCGVLPQIKRYIQEGHLFNLAFSLNDTDPLKRKKIMPIEKKYPFEQILKLFRKEMPKAHNFLTIEYVMRKDNISDENVERLSELFSGERIKLNVIPLHISSENSEIVSKKDIDNFVQKLEKLNIPVTIRKSLAYDINGACGQLSGKKYRCAAGSCA